MPNSRSSRLKSVDEHQDDEPVLTTNDISKQLSEDRKWMEGQFKAISKQINEINQRVTSLENEQKEQGKALTFYGEEIESLKKEIRNIQTAGNEATISTSRISKSVGKIEQERNLKTLIVDGVPPTNRENLFMVIEKLANELEVSCSSVDIDSVFRIRPKTDSSKPPAIIVKFNNMGARDALYDGRKQMVRQNITTKSISLDGDGSPIYINEQISIDEMELSYKARQKKKELSYKYCWTFHGNVYMRRERSSDPIRIINCASLIDLK